MCNHTDSSIFNLNKILFIRIAGSNCDLKMYLAQRNVALKLNEVNFFNIFRGAVQLESIAIEAVYGVVVVIVVSCCVFRWGRKCDMTTERKQRAAVIANGSDERLLTEDDANDVVLIKFPFAFFLQFPL